MKQEDHDECCSNGDRNLFNIGVVRATWRSFLIEREYKQHNVYTVSKYQDELRHGDNDNLTNVNCNFNTSIFMKHANKLNWNFYEIYVDYARMPHNYITSCFGK